LAKEIQTVIVVVNLVHLLFSKVKELHPRDLEVFVGRRVAPIRSGLVSQQCPFGDDHISLLVKSIIAGAEIGNGFQDTDVEFAQLVPPFEHLGYG
jgi:hypothetical protein